MSWLDDLSGIKDVLLNSVAFVRRSKLNFLGTGVSVADNDATGSTDITLQWVDNIQNALTTAAIKVTQTGATSSSSSVGGAVLLNNSANTGAGIVVYSNQAAPTGRLVSIRADSATFSQPCLYAETIGASYCAKFTHDGQANPGNCVLVQSTNEQDSSLGVIGSESGRGTIKVTHNKPTIATDDSNASALSINLAGAGTAAKGIFVDSSGVTTGDLVDVRNNNLQKFVVSPDGTITKHGGIVGVFETATTVTVTFGWTEPDVNYVPVLHVRHVSGTPDPMSALVTQISNITTTSFQFTVHTAPGAAASGAQINFAWRLERNAA